MHWRKVKAMYHPKTAMLPGMLLILMGSLDCATTVLGTLYYGASEMNPMLVGVVGNVPLFMALKLTATVFIAGTYVLSTKIINSMQDKTARSYRAGSAVIKIIYTCLVAFLVVVVANNVLVILF
jgi:hypothetical protein